MYLIWSVEHNRWWGPNSRGYTADIARAGTYSREQMQFIISDATFNWNLLPNEVPIRIEDLPAQAQKLIGKMNNGNG